MASDFDMTPSVADSEGGDDGASGAGAEALLDESGEEIRSVGGSMTALADGEEGGTAFGSRSRTKSL